MSAIQQYEQDLSRRFLHGLATLPSIEIYGLTDMERVGDRVPTFALNIKGKAPQEISARLAEEGIFCWAGHYYALEVMEGLGLVPNGALRLGFAHYNTPDEIDRVVETVSGLV